MKKGIKVSRIEDDIEMYLEKIHDYKRDIRRLEGKIQDD